MKKPPDPPDDDQTNLFDPPPVLDAKAARAGRDAGVARVEHHSEQWQRTARAFVKALVPPGWQGLSEDMRVLLMAHGLGEPHSPNCWGSLTLWCVREGLLEPTGHVQNTRDPKSHACYTKVYRRPGPYTTPL